MRFVQRTGVPLVVGLILLSIAMTASAAPRPGTIDAKFGKQGRALLPVQSQNQAVGYLESQAWPHTAVATATMPGGRAIVAGERTVVALRPDGKVDQRFGRNGRVSLPAVGEGQIVIKDVAVDSDGHVVVLAAARFAKGGGLAIVARLSADGAFDASFAGSGFLLTGFGLPAPQPLTPSAPQGAPADVLPADLALDDQGRLVVAGTAVASIAPCRSGGEQPHHVAYLARLLPDGSPDPSFGKDGTVLDARQPFYVEQHPFMGGLAVRGSGILYATDRNDGANCEGFGGGLLVRLDGAGGRDPGFGSGGILDVTPAESRPRQIAIDRRGRILVMRSATPGETGYGAGFEVVSRRNADGTLDAGFGHGGEIAVRLPGERSGFDALAVDPHGNRPLLAGHVALPRTPAQAKRQVFLPPKFVLMRLGTSGRPDRGFGEGGRVITGFGHGSRAAATGISIRGKKAIVAGPVLSPSLRGGQGFAVVRYRISR